MTKRMVSVLLSVVMLIGLIPLSAFTASASAMTVYPTTWEELREALQSEDVEEVIVSKGVTIERTMDYVNEYAAHTEIVVNGKKTMKLYGEIHFHNGLDKGLICLDSADDDLTVTGGGKITYHLYNEKCVFESDLFYLTDGKLTLNGGTFFCVDYYCPDETLKLRQAAIGGTGGTVVADYAFLHGGTIFGEGIDFVFKNTGVNGFYRGENRSYRHLDLYMTSGSATFENADFDRGIDTDPNGDAVLVMDDDVVCIDKSDKTKDADKNVIVTNKPCTFVDFDFEAMDPVMEKGTTYRNLGEIGLGDELEISAWNPFFGTGQGGKELQLFAELYVYRDDEQVYYDSTTKNMCLSYDFSEAQTGDYYVGFTLSLQFNEKTIRTLDYAYDVTVTDNITHVELALDKEDMNSLTSLDEYAGLSRITWYEKSKTDNTWTKNPTVLRDKYTYAVEFSVLSIGGKYSFADGYTVSVNGREATSLGNGMWRYEYVKTGYLPRIELYDIMRPAPGQHPDFTAHKDNPPYCDYEVIWTPFKDGTYCEPLTADDVFEADTNYLLEVVLTADDGYEFDHRNNSEAYAYINRQEAKTYYPTNDNNEITAYVYYHTGYCITDIEIADVQYPIPGKTPDEDAIVRNNGTYYSEMEWYYETNPGTAAAGFAKLDGTFKSDRRHQVYLTLETDNLFWFATDNEGNLAVNVTVDTVPVNFTYATDNDTDDGAVNTLETARTFDLAKNADGVFVDGMLLTDGLYLDNDHWGVRTEETVDKEVGYAYYNDGVLTLHNFEWNAQGDYNSIDTYRPLTIKADGENVLYSVNYGVCTGAPLTLTGDGITTFCGYQCGVFANSTVTVESGTWYVEGETYEGMWLFDDLTVNGGTLEVSGDDGGIYGDDWPTIYFNDGTLTAKSDADYAIGWCNVKTADGATVMVDTDFYGETAVPWDGETDFMDYAYIKMKREVSIVKGDINLDGAVNMRDAMVLYQFVSGAKDDLTSEQLAAGEVDGNTTLNMRDVMKLYQFVSGASDTL